MSVRAAKKKYGWQKHRRQASQLEFGLGLPHGGADSSRTRPFTWILRNHADLRCKQRITNIHVCAYIGEQCSHTFGQSLFQRPKELRKRQESSFMNTVHVVDQRAALLAGLAEAGKHASHV